MTQLVLVRHATCTQMDEILLGRRVDAALDRHGVRQARALAEALADRVPAPLVYSSPRRRARQTAAAIAARCGIRTRVRSELDEVDFGGWAGRSFTELEHDPAWRKWNTQRAGAHTPTGETIASVQARVLSLLEALVRQAPCTSIVLVTHAEVICSIVIHCMQLTPDHYDRITIDPASITMLRVHGSCIERLNERPLP